MNDEIDEAEAARRRDEVIKRMLATPPQPRKANTPSRRAGGRKASDQARENRENN